MSTSLERLDFAIRALPCPLDGVAEVTGQAVQPGWQTVARADGRTLRVDFGAGATAAQQTAALNLAQTFAWGDRVRRPLYAIYADLQALSSTQKNNVWADLAAGSPKKYLADSGPNAAAIGALDWAATDAGATGAGLTAAKLRIAAAYCQDNPGYLVQPAFDATINVAGDQPA